MNSLLLLHHPSSFLVPFTSKTLKQSIPFRLQSIYSRRLSNNNKDDYKGLNSTAPDKQLPAVRTYENDLCSLSLVGSVDFEQALTAAAADGGETADEHLASNLENMVVETVSPGDYDDRSTVSTRLFLPVKKVKEKSTKLRSSLTADILSSSSVPNNILAMTFRQVILQDLWSFKLSIFSSGTERDMEHLADTREIQIKFCISSSNVLFLSKLSEVVCSWALKNTKMSCLKNISGSSSYRIFDWPKKFLGSSTGDSSIRICRLSQSEITNGAKDHFEKKNLAEKKSYFRKQHKHNLLEPPNFSPLEKVTGAGFGEWAKEFVPAYKLQVDGNLFKDIKLEGLQEMPKNSWEALLTHTQMDKLLQILDMYYEDRYTLPDKQLSCGLAVETSITTKKFMWKLFIGSIAGVCFLIITAVFAQIYWPCLLKTRKVSDQNSTLPLIEPYTPQFKSLNTAEVCVCDFVIAVAYFITMSTPFLAW